MSGQFESIGVSLRLGLSCMAIRWATTKYEDAHWVVLSHVEVGSILNSERGTSERIKVKHLCYPALHYPKHQLEAALAYNITSQTRSITLCHNGLAK